MTKISGQFLISGQFQDNFEISGISGQLGALLKIRVVKFCAQNRLALEVLVS